MRRETSARPGPHTLDHDCFRRCSGPPSRPTGTQCTTVVVLPKPFGPRKPVTSAMPLSQELL